MKKISLILAIDTSCDDTSVAITNGTCVLANVIASQVELHRKWGGVVPDIARRAHEENLPLVIKEALARASKNSKKKITLKDLDAIAVTYGPGLAIALEIGIAKAKELAETYKIPLIPVNHMEGHLFSSLGANLKGEAPFKLTDEKFPVMGMLISGGHTELVLVHGYGKYEIIGETLDDAIGEAYDKVARMLNLGYPGGKVLTELAKEGDPKAIKFPIPMEKDKTLNFSYSGLKTAIYYYLKKQKEQKIDLNKQQIQDIAASFEYSAITHLKQRLTKALVKYPVKTIMVGGGVASSTKVRQELRKTAYENGAKIYFAYDKKMYMDNGAMIGIVAFYKAQRLKFEAKDMLELDRNPRASIEDEN